MDEILCEGEQGEELYIILEGSCIVKKGGADIAQLGAGAHLGEMALVDNSPRSATVTAAGLCRLLALSRTEFFGIIRNEPKTATKLLWSFLQVLTSRLRTTNEELRGAREAGGGDIGIIEDLTGEIFEIDLEEFDSN